MKYVTLTLIILVLSSTPLLAIGNANALQPYVAGNSQQTVVKSAAAVHMQTSFTGTTLSGNDPASGLGLPKYHEN